METYAKELDAAHVKPKGTFSLLRLTAKNLKGPLFGVPFCVNDDTSVRGMDRTLGSSKKLYKPSKGDAVIVRVLQDLGAIPFCKTNVSQTILT
jgi:Asp-tRNA(Asn)/Glu-tRNA(Gln) amidotransferase A subunit family amidase